MLRDMEELLNKIRDDEIKEYMEEALSCYNCKSYKACIILSMSAAMYDLHNKIKSLASTIKQCKELDDEIEKIKEDSKPYENVMIEKCASDKIGILSHSEEILLQNYRNYRNLCAHPSGHRSSAEEARAVFSGVIDILLSKPPLLSFNYKDVLFEQLKETTFFPYDDLDIIEKIMKQKVEMIHPSAINIIAKFLMTNIKRSHSENMAQSVQIKNAKIFVALMNKFCKLNISNLIQILIEDDICTFDLLDIIYINPEIINDLDEININKIISKISKNIESMSKLHMGEDISYLNNDNYISKIIYYILNKAIDIPSCKINELLDSIFNIRYDIQLNVISYLLEKNINKSLSDLLCKSLINYLKDIDLKEFFIMNNKYINNIIELLDTDVQLIDEIFNKINELLETGDFYYQNEAINKLRYIDSKYQQKIEDQMSVNLLINILNGSCSGAWDCQEVIKGNIENIEVIIEKSINKIINSSDPISESLNSTRGYKELIDLFINTKNEEKLNLLIDKVNTKELKFDGEIFSERYIKSVIRSINNALEDNNIEKKINIDE